MKHSLFTLILSCLCVLGFLGCSTHDENNISPLPDTNQPNGLTGNSKIIVSFLTPDKTLKSNVLNNISSPNVEATLYINDTLAQKKVVNVVSGTASLSFYSVPETGTARVFTKIEGGNVEGVKSFYGSASLGSATVNLICYPSPSGFSAIIPFHQVSSTKTLDGKTLSKISTRSFSYGSIFFNEKNELITVNSEENLINVSTGTDYGPWSAFKVGDYSLVLMEWFNGGIMGFSGSCLYKANPETKNVELFIGMDGYPSTTTIDGVSYASATFCVPYSTKTVGNKLYILTTKGQVLCASEGRINVLDSFDRLDYKSYPGYFSVDSNGNIYILDYYGPVAGITARSICKIAASGTYIPIGLPGQTTEMTDEFTFSQDAYGRPAEKVYTISRKSQMIEYAGGFLVSCGKSIIYLENGKAWAWLKSPEKETRNYDIYKSPDGSIYVSDRVGMSIYKLQ